MPQKTIKKPIEFKGIGILLGKESKIILQPAPPNTGIIFNQNIPSKVANAFFFQRTLGLKNGQRKIFFTEHLLAACYGLGINNLKVLVVGNEIPLGDGSALPFVRLINRAGIQDHPIPAKIYRLRTPTIVRLKDSFILALPAKMLTINCFVDFPLPSVGAQFWGNTLNLANFIKELAPARTFGQYRDKKFLNEFLPFKLYTQHGIILPKVFRYKNEMVRHKVLDLLGQLALLAGRLNAEIFAYKPSHQLNQQFVKRLEKIYESS